ncbi:hypothetical protein MBLNU457_4307t1 [Dothideomycetes sp. NU457]
MSGDIPEVYAPFELALQTAHGLWLDEKLEECCRKAQEILEMPGLPAYYRMRAWIVLATAVDDEDRAERYLTSAESHWEYAKAQAHSDDRAVSESLDVLRKQLDAAREYLDDQGSDADPNSGPAWDEEEAADLDEGVEQAADVELQESENASSKVRMVDMPLSSDQLEKSGSALPSRPRNSKK